MASLFISFAGGVAHAGESARLRGLRATSMGRVEVVAEGEFRVVRGVLPEAGSRGPRVYFDLRPVVLDAAFTASLETRPPEVETFRVGQFDPRTVRVVLELARGVAPGEVARWDEGGIALSSAGEVGRLVVEPSPEVDLEAIVSDLRAKLREEARARPAPPSRRAVRRLSVIIDPGHGGRDVGALGVGGVEEKTVNLKTARALAKALRGRGFRVGLTRDDDRYLSLEERVAKAHAWDADLVISIHANAHRSRSIHGVETFHAGRDSSEASRRLARVVQQSLVRGLKARRASVRDLGVKHARFFVLQFTRMPAILVETGFLTHPEEGRALASPRYRGAIARALAIGVSRFAGPASETRSRDTLAINRGNHQ